MLRFAYNADLVAMVKTVPSYAPVLGPGHQEWTVDAYYARRIAEEMAALGCLITGLESKPERPMQQRNGDMYCSRCRQRAYPRRSSTIAAYGMGIRRGGPGAARGQAMTDIGPERPTVERTVFSTPRSGEFLELRALQAQTGQPAEAFGHVVVKELLDNALDAAESAGRAPVIEITTRTDDEITFVTVTDNGAGITPDVVAGLCDFTMLVSDKARYRGPTRGAQGNALKTVLGIPYALGVAEPVVIESAGVRHELRVTVDRVGDVVVTHETTASDRTVGTSVTVPLPAAPQKSTPGGGRINAALVNPHATISVIEPD